MKELPIDLHELSAPDQCALMVIDKQRWYLDPAVSPFLAGADGRVTEEELSRHDRFIDLSRAAGVPVIWTVMTEGDDHAPENVLARWRRRPEEPRLRRGDVGFAFAGGQPTSAETIFEKVYPDAFSVCGVAEHLNSIGRSTVVVIGGYAARCVLATAFGAQARGFHVIVPRGLAEPHPRQVHEEQVFLAVIDSVVGHVLDPEQILRRWNQA